MPIIIAMSSVDSMSHLKSADMDTVVMTSSAGLEPILEIIRLSKDLSDPPDDVIVKVEADKEVIQELSEAGCPHIVEGYEELEKVIEIIESLLEKVSTDEKDRSMVVKGKIVTSFESMLKKQPLSRREREILHNLLQGLGNRKISKKLGISEKTVKNHLWKIYKKLGIGNRTELFHKLLISCPCMAIRTSKT